MKACRYWASWHFLAAFESGESFPGPSKAWTQHDTVDTTIANSGIRSRTCLRRHVHEDHWRLRLQMTGKRGKHPPRPGMNPQSIGQVGA